MPTLARVLYDSVNSRVAKFIDDSGDSLLAIVGKLRNAAGTIVNPSTEDKQDDAITKLTSIDGKDFATETTLASLEGKDFATETTLATRASESTLATRASEATLATRASEATLAQADGRLATIDAVLDSIKDTDGVKKITDPLPVGDNIIGRVKLSDGTHVLLLKADGDSWTTDYGLPVVSRDSSDTVRRLLSETDGALIVASRIPVAPPGTTPFTLAVNEAELNVGAGGDVASPNTTLGSIIGSGVDVYVQNIGVGTEGDSSENGSVVEVYWREGAGPTDHLIDRIYVMGETVDVQLPNVHTARDGTALTGNGTNTRLAVVRKRLSLAALEIDFVVRGYTI